MRNPRTRAINVADVESQSKLAAWRLSCVLKLCCSGFGLPVDRVNSGQQTKESVTLPAKKASAVPHRRGCDP